MLIDENVDLGAIGQSLLGWRWARATEADRLAFAREFRRYLVQNFALKVTGPGEGGMTVTGTRPDAGGVVVSTQPAADGTAAAVINWRVVDTEAGWRLIDLTVDGISLASAIRARFDATLQDAKPDIRPLCGLLHEGSAE